MRSYKFLFIAIMPLIACGQASFSSIEPREEPAAPVETVSQDAVIDIPVNTRSPEVADASKKPADLPPAAQPAENQVALNQCREQWQGQVLAEELQKKAKIVEVNQFKGGELVFEDLDVTNEPVMYLINVNFNIAASGNMQLRNPNGWYCVNIRAQSIKTFDISVNCRTVIATVTRPGQTFDRFEIQRDAPCS